MAQDPKNFLGGLVRWDRTSRIKQRIAWKTEEVFHPSLGRAAGYQGHHIIGRDCPVREGVYLGTYEREAIVVTESDPALIHKYVDLLDRLHAKRLNEGEILAQVYGFVREEITSESVNELLAAKGIGADQKVSLALFVGHGVGVCRHRALFAAYLLEKLAEQGVIHGRVSVDRNEMPEGGHAWARFTNADGVVTIVDAMLGYCGPITDEGMPWEYARPDKKTSQPKPRGGGIMATRRNLIALVVFAVVCENAGVGLVMKRATDATLTARQAELQKEYDGYRALADLDVEAQKRLVEKNESDLNAAAATIARQQAEIDALKHEFDPDGDGVKIPNDACPDTKFAPGYGTELHPNGCGNDEIVRAGCERWEYPGDVKTGSVGKVDWIGCALTPAPGLVFRCEWSAEFQSWSLGCYPFDPTNPGG